MKKTIVMLLLALCMACTACAFTACKTEDNPKPEEPTCNHTYADEYTCHDRACTAEGCDHVEKATTEHAYGEWTVLREAGCETTGTQKRTCACGAEEEGTIPAAGHKYADEHTCHDRTCTVDDCEHIEPASTAHSFSEWKTTKPATCSEKGEKKRTCTACGAEEKQAVVKDHEFDQDGVCGMCEKDIKELLIQPFGDGEISAEDVTVTFDSSNGKYVVSSKASPKADAYAVIPGTLLTELTKLGYTELSFTAINTAPGLADATDKCKTFIIAADSTANLWSESAAIAYWGWIAFWDNGKKAEFTIDLETYKGRDLYIYATYCESYPLELEVKELKASAENPARRLTASENCTVEYIEGKGWHVDALNTTQDFYAKIEGEILTHYIAQGYKSLKLAFVNELDFGYTTEGNPVNAQIAILPKNAAGSNDWNYCNGFISQKCTKNETTGAFEFVIDLTSESYDFSKGVSIYFKASDVSNKKTDHFYLTEMEFSKEA